MTKSKDQLWFYLSKILRKLLFSYFRKRQKFSIMSGYETSITLYRHRGERNRNSKICLRKWKQFRIIPKLQNTNSAPMQMRGMRQRVVVKGPQNGKQVPFKSQISRKTTLKSSETVLCQKVKHNCSLQKSKQLEVFENVFS